MTPTPSPSQKLPNPIRTHTSTNKIQPSSSPNLLTCSTCSNPFPPPSPSFPSNSLIACRKCGTYLKPSAFDYHYRLTHSPDNNSFHTCPCCLPLLTKPVSNNPQTPPTKSPASGMFHTHSNTHKISNDPSAFAAAAAAAQAAASHQMSSAQHPHISSAAAAAAAAVSSQFAIPVPLASDPTHATFSTAPPAQNHLFDRSDQSHHPLSLAQSSPVFTSQHQSTQHHLNHIQAAKNHHPRHLGLPSASQSQPLPHLQQPHQQPLRKGKRPAGSAPAPPIPRPHRTSMSNPADQSQQHSVAMVAQDSHTFARLAAPPVVNVTQSTDNRNGSPLRNDPLYPHIATRAPHQQQQTQQHQPIVSGVASHPEQHIAIQPQPTSQQHHTGIRNVPGSFTGAQLPDGRVQAATRLSFEEDARRRAGNTQTASQQNNAVMLQFPDNYIAQQQDGMNENRQRAMNISEPITHHQREAQPRFDGDTGTLVAQGMAYDIKEGDVDQKRVAANGGASSDAVLTSGGLDPAAINRQSNMMAARTATRVGPDGRPMNPSAFIHGTIEKRVACENCGLLFGDVGSLKRHAARSHRAATGKGPVFCPQCNASLKNEQNLRRHIAVCHSGDQENRCDMCNASFSSRGSLRIHQQQVHQVPPGSKNGRSGRGGRGGGRGGRVGGINKSSKSDKSYVCDMCTDTFKWKGNLKRHRELRHLHLRPFFCQICNASFGTKSNMRVHLITHNNTQNK